MLVHQRVAGFDLHGSANHREGQKKLRLGLTPFGTGPRHPKLVLQVQPPKEMVVQPSTSPKKMESSIELLQPPAMDWSWDSLQTV